MILDRAMNSFVQSLPTQSILFLMNDHLTFISGNYLGNLSMREILVMTSHTSTHTVCGGGVWQFSLAANHMAALHVAIRIFLARNHISDEQWDKERKVVEKRKSMRQQNWRNLSQGRRRRENFNEKHHKAESNRAREETLIYNG